MDAPEIEDKINQVMLENGSGYISCTVRKLCPCGIADYHDSKQSLRARDSFADWERCIMLVSDIGLMHNSCRSLKLDKRLET